MHLNYNLSFYLSLRGGDSNGQEMIEVRLRDTVSVPPGI